MPVFIPWPPTGEWTCAASPRRKSAAVAEVLGDAVMDAVGGEPVDPLDVDVDPVEDALGDVVPGEVVVGLFRLFVANRADEADAATVVEREDGEEVGVVERDVELAVGDRARGLDVGDVEEVRVFAAGKPMLSDCRTMERAPSQPARKAQRQVCSEPSARRSRAVIGLSVAVGDSVKARSSVGRST